MPHVFEESLARSHSYAKAPWWFEVYRKAFPGVRSCVDVRADGWAQRGGIDRVITLDSGRVIRIDEKVREKAWSDILLERWSNEEKRIAGWIQKPLACEFIAYAFVPSRICYLFPTLTLQKAWRLHGRSWCEQFEHVRARNNGYTTLSIAVPIDDVFAALSDAMRIEWEPSTDDLSIYDSDDDIRKSVAEGFRAIRERKANGGPGWSKE